MTKKYFDNNNNNNNNNNNIRLFDRRHTAQSNTINIRHTGQSYTEGLSGKLQATNGAQRLINRT